MLRRYPFVSILLACYTFHLGLKFGRVPVSLFMSHYFADLLCMPLLLSMAVIAMRMVKAVPNLQLNGLMIVFSSGLVAFVFEYWLPRNWQRYTADMMDVVMYGLGGLFFYVFQSKLLPHQHPYDRSTQPGSRI